MGTDLLSIKSSRATKHIPAPQSINELYNRALKLAGITVGELADRLSIKLPSEMRQAKGKIGQLVEKCLGAQGGNEDEPDFPHLGVELKTIPIDHRGRVRESTFVCCMDFSGVDQEEWESSRLYRKLSCVLWIPVEVDSRRTLLQRRLGQPFLWRPTATQLELLQSDWLSLMGKIALGKIDEVSGYLGQVLQLRPKAPNRQGLTMAPGAEGERLSTIRRGFYLRAKYTEEILGAIAAQSDVDHKRS